MNTRRSARGASPRQPQAGSASKQDVAMGASAVSTSLADRVRAYFTHHREALSTTCGRIKKEKTQTFLTCLVVAIALALPAILLVGLQNFQTLGEQWDTEPKVTVYLHTRAKQAAIDRLLDSLDRDPRVKSARFISAKQALEEFETFAGFGDALAGLSANPLPAAIEIALAPSYQRATDQRAFADELSASSLVEEASIDLSWVERFLAITELVRQTVWILAVLLALGAVLVISNTVRLIIENRRDEIVVVKLVGGTDAFVKRPLIYTGLLYGSIGAALAVLVVAVVQVVIATAVEAVAASYDSVFAIRSLSLIQIAQLLVAGALLGCLGALLATHRHIREIEP